MSGSTATNLKPGDKIGLAYDLGDLESPTYGSIKNVRGIIPLLLSYGEYPFPPILKEPERLARLARELRIQFASAFENELDEDVEAKIRDYCITVLTLYPTEDIETERMRALAIASIMVFLADDIFDTLGGSEGPDSIDMSYESGYGESVMVDLMTKKYKSVEEAPKLVPAFTPFITVALGFMEACDRAVPNFRERDEQTRVERLRGYNSMLLVAEKKNSNILGFSDNVVMNLSGLQAGFLPVLEYLANVYEFNVTKEIRNDVVFQIFIQAVANVSSLMNAVFGLGRDLKLGQVDGSGILEQVVYKGKSLEEAYRNTVDRLNDNMNDIRLAGKKLRGRYKNNPSLEKYIRAGEYIVDGQYIAYSNVARYGQINLRVEKMSTGEKDETV